MTLAIETGDLTKRYGDKVGCEDICLSVPKGQIFGFLGPNGAGKSTLVKMLVGLLRPSSGSGSLLGKPIGHPRTRRKVGFLPENFRYHEWMTGRHLLDFHASLYGMSRQDKLQRIPLVLDLAGVTEAGGRKVRTYSKGMQQRLGMAVALLNDPDLLFLDEPTSALDPIGRREVREMLQRLKERGKTIFLNSHLLSEVEMICDQVAFIKEGRIIAQGSLESLQAGRAVVELTVEDMGDDLIKELTKISKIITSSRNIVRVSVGSREEIPMLAEAVVRGGGKLYKLAHDKVSLEELFVNLLQEGN